MDEAIDEFIHRLKEIVGMFVQLQKLYNDDDNRFFSLLDCFKDYLKSLKEVYPAIDIFLQEEDVTPDDLKIFICGYKTKKDLKQAFSWNEIPLFVDYNTRYRRLQAHVIQDIINDRDEDLHFLGHIAIQGMKQKNIKPPKSLLHLCSFDDNFFSHARKSRHRVR